MGGGVEAMAGTGGGMGMGGGVGAISGTAGLVICNNGNQSIREE